jgi:ornithine carbamoyltransferase
MANLKGRDYIETQDLSDDEIGLLLDTATDLKKKYHRGEPTLLLPHQTAFLLFFDKSTRTRNAFEAGMTQLGGHAHFLDSDATQISHGETPEDTGKILSSMGHGICIRHDPKALVHLPVNLFHFSAALHIGLTKAEVNVVIRIGLTDGSGRGNHDHR